MYSELEIPGYRITGEVDRTPLRALLKGVSDENGNPVLLKIVDNNGNGSQSHARLRRELSILEQYGLDVVPKPHRLIKLKDAIVLVMDDFGTITLKGLTAQFPLPIATFLEIAEHITFAVAQLHGKGITHALLHPGIILFSPEGNGVKLTDLESASLLTDEFTGYVNLNRYDRSLLYMAPEQSGRINRTVDFRSNLYSLGAIFYEMLTGRPVFDSTDMVEVVHAHIARTPDPISNYNTSVPGSLSDLVNKLLAKNSEDRYQTVGGLMHDITLLKEGWGRDGLKEKVALCTADHAGKLHFSQRLYGRIEEVKQLLDGFDEAAQGEVAVSLVAGYSGIGKSALVAEVNRPILKHRGLMVSGKYDQLRKNVPYSALLHALRQLVLQALTEDDDRIRARKATLLKALEGNGKLMTDVVPELELLIGKQEAVVELPAAEAQNRFRDTLTALVCSFAAKEHPLTIFIDDLQWADTSTIDFFAQLAVGGIGHYIYLIGAYRDNEVDGSHPLTLAVNTLRDKGKVIRQINLRPLSEDSVRHFLADSLRCPMHEVRGLTEVVVKKTGANPYFIKAFVTRLVDDRLIAFDPAKRGWKWEVEAIQTAQITDNVVDLLSHRMARIPEAPQQQLKVAACLGNEFDLRTLSGIMGRTQAETARTLWESLTNGFIFPLDEAYKSAENHDGHDAPVVRYRFAHDRVQQAAYSLLNEKERAETHLLIARNLLSSYNKEELEEHLFDVTDHYNAGIALVKESAERKKVLDLNLRAALRAKESVAFGVAASMLAQARALIGHDGWSTDHATMAEVALQQAECHYILGEYDRTEELFNELGRNLKSAAHLARLNDIQVRQFSQQGRNLETLEKGAEVLRSLGVKFKAKPSLLEVAPELIYSKIILAGKDIAALSRHKEMTDPEMRQAMDMLLNISATAYVFSANTMLLLVNKMTQITVKYGIAPSSAFGLGLFGFIEGAALGNFKNSRLFSELSLELIKDSRDPILIGKVKYLKCFANQHWYEPVQDALPMLHESYRLLYNSGSYIFASYAVLTITMKELYAGLPLNEVYARSVDYSGFVARVKEDIGINLLRVQRRYMSGLTGHFHPDFEEVDRNYDVAAYAEDLRSKGFLMAQAFHHVHHAMLHHLMGEHGQAMEQIKAGAMVDEGAPTTMAQIEFHLYRVLVFAREYASASPMDRMGLNLRAGLSLSNLKKWAGAQEQNFASRHLLARAAWASAKGRAEANDLFTACIASATKHNQPHILALAHETFGKHLLNGADRTKAHEHIRAAEKGWRDWGAVRKADHLCHEFPELFAKARPLEVASTVPFSGMMDVESVLRASQAIAGEIVLVNLLKKLLRILMENLGAQRGFLILNRNGQLLIEARADEKEAQVLQSEPVTATDQLSASAVNIAFRTGKELLLDNAGSDESLASDSYIIRHKVRSLFCLPVKNQGKVVAIAYFENNLVTGAFTHDRVSMTNMLASQAAISIENAILYDNMEQMVRERTMELTDEKKRTDDLLLNILPEETAKELKTKGTADARLYVNTTVLFTDFEGFTSLAEKLPAKDLVGMLDSYFRAYDRVIKKHGLEKIKTIGDAYMAASGLKESRGSHARDAVMTALELKALTDEMYADRTAQGLPAFKVRIGLSSGPVIAGVVGEHKFQYDIWGDTVNTASRMESSGEVGKVNISEATYALVKDDFACEYRGEVAAKGKGKMGMWFVKQT